MDTTNLVVLDWDTNTWRCCFADDDIDKVSTDVLLSEAFARRIAGADLIVEAPHLQPRTAASKAQVMTASQLQTFYDNMTGNGVTIYAFPHRLTKRAGVESGHVDNRGNVVKKMDTLSLKMYVAKWDLAMKRWAPSRSATAADNAVAAIREDVKLRMNKLRADGPDGKMVDQLDYINMMDAIRGICRNATDDDAEHIAYYGIEFMTPKGRMKKTPTIRHAEPLALWLMIRNEDGSLRTRPDGQFVGIKFLRDRVGALHMYGKGIVRSQVMWHGRKNIEVRAADGRKLNWELETAEQLEARQVVRADSRRHTLWLMKQFRDFDN